MSSRSAQLILDSLRTSASVKGSDHADDMAIAMLVAVVNWMIETNGETEAEGAEVTAGVLDRIIHNDLLPMMRPKWQPNDR